MSELCEFCEREFKTLNGLKIHCVKVHSAKMDAAKDEAFEEWEARKEREARKLSREYTGDEDSWVVFV